MTTAIVLPAWLGSADPASPGPGPAAIDALTDLAQSLPWGPLGFAAVVAGVGLTLWLAGGGLLRFATALVAATVGVALGYAIVRGGGFGFSPWIGAGVIGLAGLAAGLWLLRLSMAFALAVTLGVLAPTVAGVATGVHQKLVEGDGRPLSELEMLLPGVPTLGEGEEPDAGALAPPTVDAAQRRARAFLDALADEAEAYWKRIPEDDRRVLVIAALAGALAGFVVGMLAPKVSAAVVTSFVGAALWLTAGVWLSESLGAPYLASLPTSTLAWLVIWSLVSVAGAGAQIGMLRRRAKREKKAPPAPKADKSE